MLKSEAAAYLAGVTQTEGAEASAPTNLHVITGEVGEASADGKTLVKIDGLMFSESDDQFIEVDALGGLEEGDIATIVLTGEQGHAMTPLALGSIGSVDRITVRIAAIEADYIKVEQLDAATARIGELEADHVSVDDLNAATARIGTLETTRATITDLEAATARIHSLEVDHVSIDDFEAEQANIDQLQADTADIDTIRANSAKVQNLTAAQLEADHATIGSLDTTYATIANLNAVNGRITNLESTKANISDLEADYITADEIEATYMHANMSNSDVAWIENGTIKNGAIVSAMINDVSANKLTAGTINGSVINVTNLNADNITTGTINGQRIGEGSLSLDKLSEDVYTEAEVDTIVEGLNDRIDGAIETHTGTAVPTLNNAPASSWNTTALRDEHIGDVYYVVNSQSQQNGYCYRFTKSGSTYSWQLIKDSDVTAALSRLTTAEGKITTFDSDISTLKTTTGTLTTKTESLETRMSDAEADILDKVDTTTFNEVSDTVDSHSQSITQMTTTLSNKADSSTVTAVTNRVSKNEQDISGINTTIGELQDTVETKADGSTVSTISNKLNTVSDTVDGHTSQLSSITSTQTTMQSTLDKTVKSSIQLWYSKANTTAPSKPTSKVTSTSTSGNAWRIVVPAYNSSYPHYYYCWQYEYTDGTYGWSAVVRDIAMGESQSTARTADSNASAAVTTANTANTNASTALSTANTANTNASEAKTTATTASTTASEAKTTAETAANDASTAKTNAASAVTTANSANTKANANIKSSVQLWFTKANSTAPNKPTSVVSTSNANTANAWNLVVPVWNKNYPHYFYCYQQQKGDGNYQWTDVVYDRATSESQQLANTTSTNLSTLQTDYATFKQTTEQFESTVGSRLTTIESDIDGVEERVSDNETSISNNASAIALKANSSDVYTKTAVDGKITQEVSDRNAAITAKANEINLSVTEKVYQGAQPNLMPMFSMDFDDIYNATSNPDGYWNILDSSRITQGENGWAHVSASGGGTTRFSVNPNFGGEVKPSVTYTALVEIKNLTSTGTVQFIINIDGQWSQSSYFDASSYFYPENGSKYITLSSHSSFGSATTILYGYFYLSGTSPSLECDIRISLYEGEYSGPYKPYSGTQLYASQAELKVQADRIGMVVANNDASSSLQLTPASITAVTNNLTIKDSSGSATVISGGKIQANSIGADEIAANAVTADKLAANSLTIGKFTEADKAKVDNSYVQVGGRNLLAWSDRKGAMGTSSSGLSWTYDADGWITVTGTINSSSAGLLLFWGTSTATNYVYPAGTYTVTVENDGLLAANVLRAQIGYDGTYTYLYDSGSLTLDTENGISRVCLYRYGASGTSVNGRIRFKMEKGNKATDWTPAPEDQTAYVDAIQVGGRNLLLRTATLSDTTYWWRNSITSVIENETDERGGSDAVLVTPSTTSWYLASTNDNTRINDIGGQYVASVWMRADTETNVQLCCRYLKNDTDLYSNNATRKLVTVTTEWQQFAVAGKMINNQTSENNCVWVGQLTSVPVYVSHFKFERGNKPTDWTPAPEDQIDAIDQTYIQNLTPYFLTDMTKTSDEYWANLTYERFTRLGDGWAHFEYTNSGSSTVNNYIKPKVLDFLEPGGKYTLLIEFKNVSISKDGGSFYSQQGGDVQVWGDKSYCGFAITNAEIRALSGGAGTFYKTLTLLTADSKDPSGTVRGSLPKTSFMSINQQVQASQTVSYDLRLSLYEDGYTGPYKPYGGDQLYATNSALAGTNESLEGAITDIGELSDQLVDTTTEQNKTITDIQKYLNSLRQDLDAEIQSRQQWLNFNSAEGLVIGAAGSSFKTVTTNTSQQFRSGGTVLAETSGSEFVAPVMRSDQILIGNWMWTRRDNGNLSLKWIG